MQILYVYIVSYCEVYVYFNENKFLNFPLNLTYTM